MSDAFELEICQGKYRYRYEAGKQEVWRNGYIWQTLNGKLIGDKFVFSLAVELDEALKECDALRADKATLQQMTYSLKDRLEVAEKERNNFAQQLVQSEIGKREISEAHDALQVEVGKLKDLEVSRCVKINRYIVDNARLAEEVERLQAKIEQMERQEPVATIHINSITGNPSVDFTPGHRYLHHNSSLYALPGAKGEKDVCMAETNF